MRISFCRLIGWLITSVARVALLKQDYMLAYSLRKYAGVRSFVVPMDLYNSQTWGNTDVDWSMQHQVGDALALCRLPYSFDH